MSALKAGLTCELGVPTPLWLGRLELCAGSPAGEPFLLLVPEFSHQKMETELSGVPGGGNDEHTLWK